MSWSVFVFIVAGLITFVTLLIALPWLQKKAVHGGTLSNTQVVRQRLEELKRERDEGLISESDLRQASNEIKIALVDESVEQQQRGQNATIPLWVGGAIAVVIGVIVYVQVNNLAPLERKISAIETLPELSAKLAAGNSSDISNEDVQDLTLAIRSRLREQPEDAQGWMFLGRLWTAIGQQEQAFAAFDKALALTPNDMNVRISYVQALMATNEIEQLQKAKRLLNGLLANEPENDNLALMMTVVSAQLGDGETAQVYFSKLAGKLPQSNPLYSQLKERIEELTSGEGNTVTAQTGFTVTVSISDSLKGKIPEQAYLFVFAQDGLSANRMPAAVVKLPLVDLPASVTLTTDNAMTPNYTLATLSKAKLVARISATDSAMPISGDLQGTISVSVIAGEIVSHSILINEELP